MTMIAFSDWSHKTSVSQDKPRATGMTVEQVLRAAIIKQVESYSYTDLGFHLADSKGYRQFCKIYFTIKY